MVIDESLPRIKAVEIKVNDTFIEKNLIFHYQVHKLIGFNPSTVQESSRLLIVFSLIALVLSKTNSIKHFSNLDLLNISSFN